MNSLHSLILAIMLFGQAPSIVFAQENHLGEKPLDIKAIKQEAMALRDGKVVPKDSGKALRLYEQACKAGDGEACLKVGLMHFNGEAGPKNVELAASYYKIGCELGNATACYNLATMNRLGTGVPKDITNAISLLQKSCDGGEAWACNDLGNAYLIGIDVPRNIDLGLQLLNKACDMGDSMACRTLGKQYFNGTDVKKDSRKALVYFSKAALFGDWEISRWLDDRMLHNSKLPAEFMPIIKEWEIAGNQGNTEARVNLALALLANVGGQDRPKNGTEILQVECARGNSQACKLMGLLGSTKP